MQKVVAEDSDKAQQLQQTVVALREELDTIKGRYEDKIQGMERAARDEIKQLQETAAALREKLETENGE